MSLHEWFIIALYICFLMMCAHGFQQIHSRLLRLRKALDEAEMKICQLKEVHLQKESRHEKTEDKLRSYLQLLDALINTMPNPICFKDEHGVFKGCNKIFAQQILGLTRDHIIGNRAQDIPEHIPPDLAALYHREEMISLKQGDFHTFEAKVRCADGIQRDFLFSMAPIHNQDGKAIGTVTVLSDLTDKNRAVKDRLLKEKLESVLETAGGVCHELNQPLQALSGNLEILAVKMQFSPEALDHIEKAMEQIERMRTITDNLQGITRYETLAYTGNTKIIDIHKSSNRPKGKKADASV